MSSMSASLISWWHRLLLASVALIGPVIVSTIVYTLHHLYVTPTSETDWHHMGGDIQLVLLVLFAQTVAALFTFAVFVAPLVLLCSIETQLQRWVWILALSLLWFPLLYTMSMHDFGAMKRLFNPPLFLWAELMASVCCGLYLFLIRRASRQKLTQP